MSLQPNPGFGKHLRTCVERIGAWLLVANFMVLGASGLSGQDKVTVSKEQWETGFHAFSQVMRKRGVEIASDYQSWRDYPASQRILILMGAISNEDKSYIDQFVNNGGSVLLATDVSTGLIRVGPYGIMIEQGGAISAMSRRDRYNRVGQWPIVRQLDQDDPLFDGIRFVVPNYPALLKVVPTPNESLGWKTLATYPTLMPGRKRNQPFIVRYLSPSGGRLLVVPDHSIYVNGSAVINDNLRFMLNTVDWLQQSNRTKCLFVLNRASTMPPNVSNIDLYRAPPGAAETKRALKNLWNKTTTKEKLELANDALEFAQEEQLIEQMIDAIYLDEMISRNRLLAVLLVLGTWCIIVPFVVILVSNRKKPLDGKSADGLMPIKKKETKRRERLERSRAAEALFVHFFNRIGFDITSPDEVDVDRIQINGNDRDFGQLIKDILRIQKDLMRQPIDYWTEARVEDVGRHIAQWANLSETGVLRVESPATSADW